MGFTDLFSGDFSSLFGGSGASSEGAKSDAKNKTGFSPLLSGLQGGATIASMLAERRSGREKALSLQLAAQDVDVEMQSEIINGVNRRTSLRDALLTSVGERQAAVSASGVDSTFGTSAQINKELAVSADRAESNDAATQAMRVARLKERQDNLNAAALKAKKSGDQAALVRGLSGLTSIISRGS